MTVKELRKLLSRYQGDRSGNHLHPYYWDREEGRLRWTRNDQFEIGPRNKRAHTETD